jgi:ketosteroid isomerase-like protein
MSSDFEVRLDRLESTEAIRQLASRYALAIDVRDLDAVAELFVEDVRVGPNRSGRPALKAWFDGFMRNRFRETAHMVMNHVIEFQSADEANGVVYCRAEHELGDRFVVQQMQYRDQYARRDDIWLFVRRLPLAWYATDVLDRPVGAKKVRWPDADPSVGELPGWWGSWGEYWAGPPADGVSVRGPAPPGRWLERLKRRTPE